MRPRLSGAGGAFFGFAFLRGAGFSMRGFVLARTKTHKLESPCCNSISNTPAAKEAAGKSSLMSSRAKRGICFFHQTQEKDRFLGQTAPWE